MEENSKWKDVIRLKYKVEDGGWCTKIPKGGARANLWKDIRKETEQVQYQCIFALGDGSRVRFWEVNWCGEGPLREAFPALYLLADSKGAKVAEVWDSSRGERVWSPVFVRPFNDWEVEEVQNFLNLVNNCRVNQEENDRLVWKGDKNALYFVKANTALLEGSAGRIAPWKLVWNSIVSPKISFFAWEVWWGKILTMEQLKKRGFQLASRCPLCGNAEKDLNHFLLHY